MQQTLTSATLFAAVVPVVPVVIPLAIDCDFMVTFSQPTLNTAVITNNTSNNTDGNTERIHNTIVRRANHKTTMHIFIMILSYSSSCFIGVFFGAFLGPIFAILLLNAVMFFIVINVLIERSLSKKLPLKTKQIDCF